MSLERADFSFSADEAEKLTRNIKHLNSAGEKKPGKHPFKSVGWTLLGIAAGIIFLLAAGGFGYAAVNEENDAFCASCHTEPESTYYERSLAAAPVDMASAHHTTDDQNSKCIDCHSGIGITGRISAILLGARNTFLLVTHTETQPAPLTVPIGDENCTKCHDDTNRQTDLSNHFHAFLARWQAIDSQAAGCVDCHRAHTTGGEAAQGFLQAEHIDPVCERCHTVLVLGR
jgi:predicted CXXCH cytochrome family protein